ncbi:MAG: hypothetical protein IKC50_07250, partial [Oscillospiraceae bacterium]|nr:hypothetical protein [Oscillospiraceae bacterium]
LVGRLCRAAGSKAQYENECKDHRKNLFHSRFLLSFWVFPNSIIALLERLVNGRNFFRHFNQIIPLRFAYIPLP